MPEAGGRGGSHSKPWCSPARAVPAALRGPQDSPLYLTSYGSGVLGAIQSPGRLCITQDAETKGRCSASDQDEVPRGWDFGTTVGVQASGPQRAVTKNENPQCRMRPHHRLKTLSAHLMRLVVCPKIWWEWDGATSTGRCRVHTAGVPLEPLVKK